MKGIISELAKFGLLSDTQLRLRAFGRAQVTIKPSGDGRAGVVNWKHDDASGYLYHSTAGPNSGNGTAMYAAGTDEGHGGGFLASNKNDSFGYRLINNPGAGYGFYATSYAANAVDLTEVYTGAKGSRIKAELGAGFSDGVANSTTTFTSATAAFVAGDVGQTITQLTNVGSISPTGCIPAGTTILSVTNGTTVVLSQASTASGTGVRFVIGARARLGTEEYWSFYGTDNVKRGALTYNIWDMAIGGRFRGAFASQQSLIAKAAASSATQTGDIFAVVTDLDAILSRFNKFGTFMTKVKAAPADADISTSELSFWFDDTPTTGGLKLKGKNSSGTVVTATIVMA